jgi:hypothetical protein
MTLMEFAIAIAGVADGRRLQAGVYPLWGLTYYRWWLADRLVESAPAYLLSRLLAVCQLVAARARRQGRRRRR